MSYLVFARKFRPQDFDEIVGQEPIVTTLKNAISQNRVPQNFLFSGPRGVGKTSTARILAKALNCQKGPTDTPCQKCLSCIEITKGNSLDVLEIDGASNRGIDEIRNLRETVKFKPVTGRIKIYVIDEVHMLTTEAFNALLKTLEEPPPHVKFIFATTEPHKVPLTILSRCQRFSFKRIPTIEVVEKLREIAEKENLKFDKKAIFQIAKSCDGSLRDAESILDQMVSFSGDKIKEEDVLAALGLASEEVYFETLTALKAKDAGKIFSIVTELYNGGRDLTQYAKGLLEIFRHLLLLQCAQQAEKFIEMSEDGLRELKSRKDLFNQGELLLALSLLGSLQGQLRKNIASPKILVEITLLKLVHVDGLRFVEDMSRQSGGRSSGPAKELLNKSPGGHPFNYAPTAKRSEQPSVSASEFQVRPENVQKKGNKNITESAVKNSEEKSFDLDQIESIWPRVIEYVKAKRMSIGIFLSESEPVEVSGSVITLGLPSEFQFHKEMLERDTNKFLVQEAFQVVTGCRVTVMFVVTQLEGNASKEVTEGEQDRAGLPEIINQAMEIFEGAKIIRKE